MTNESPMETDLLIIGAGPAGYTASIYASRYKINHIVIGELMGGQAGEAHKVCNFPGITEKSGIELMQMFSEHAKSLGAEFLTDKVIKIEKKEPGFSVETSRNGTISAKTILLAIGTSHRKLGIERENEMLGKGVSYCVTCDGAFFKDKVVAVVGGSDAANSASVYLSQMAKKVYQIYRGEELRGESTWVNDVLSNDKIEVIFNTNIVELGGKDQLEFIVLDREYNGSNKLAVDGLFIEIGSAPGKALINHLEIKTDPEGYIEITQEQRTSVEGIWAAGDVTTGSNKFRQIVTASAEGAVAASDIFKYLKTKGN
ncbi:FAD-dependent oxidoreductase [Candidatus Dojkabacteria bacterium]|nr:FAD-dependent oxidoreductase [Candidatus Dojkabacteria bacterium]